MMLNVRLAPIFSVNMARPLHFAWDPYDLTPTLDSWTLDSGVGASGGGNLIIMRETVQAHEQNSDRRHLG